MSSCPWLCKCQFPAFRCVDSKKWDTKLNINSQDNTDVMSEDMGNSHSHNTYHFKIPLLIWTNIREFWTVVFKQIDRYENTNTCVWLWNPLTHKHHCKINFPRRRGTENVARLLKRVTPSYNRSWQAKNIMLTTTYSQVCAADDHLDAVSQCQLNFFHLMKNLLA